MKQFIVLCSMVLLGVAIFHLIMGNSDDSVINTVKDLWQNQLQMKIKNP